MLSFRIISSLIICLLQPVNYHSRISQILTQKISDTKVEMVNNSLKKDYLLNNGGLHFTEEELKIWRQRAQSGPYRRAGDVSRNSPGDWERITRNGIAFLKNPEKEIWKGDTSNNECVQKNSAEPIYNGIKLKDAAFVFLINKEMEYGSQVKRILLTQAKEPLTDFSNRSRWCDNVLHDINPSFLIAEWLTRLLFAYDYSKNVFNAQEKIIMDRWFKEGAYFFRNNLDSDFNRVFKNRPQGDYTLSKYAIGSRVDQSKSVAFENGWKIPNMAKRYNNRYGSIAKFVGLAGIFLKDKSLKNSSKQFVKEWVIFSMFPDGIIGEYERWKEGFPDLGWSYAAMMIAIVTEIADGFAREGDFELYNYNTSRGAFGTEGGKKSILLSIKKLFSFLEAGCTYRIPIQPGKSYPKEYALIDGSFEDRNWNTVSDTWFSQCNIFYKETYITENYLRKCKGRKPYPEGKKLATMGPHQPWSGSWGNYPGVLFMFGQMEGKVWPYPGK